MNIDTRGWDDPSDRVYISMEAYREMASYFFEVWDRYYCSSTKETQEGASKLEVLCLGLKEWYNYPKDYVLGFARARKLGDGDGLSRWMSCKPVTWLDLKYDGFDTTFLEQARYH